MKAPVEHQNLLIELQQIDSGISTAQAKIKALPEREQLAAITLRMKSTEEELALVEAELADVKIDLRRSEVDVETVADRMAKDENRMSSGSASPKELEQLQHEIETLKKRKSELEDHELEIMMRHDSVKERFDALKNDQVGLQQLELELNVRLENAITALQAEVDLAKAQRVELLPRIDVPLVELYEKIRAGNSGMGAALLVGNTCGGCHLAINAGEMERIKSLATDEVLRCDECRTILVRI
jgi:predicted  nucleic acid-binding Zn-ribbon protein